MAKPSFKITKTQFNQEYNITEVLTDITSIMNKLKTFKSNNQAVAFATKKEHNESKLDLILKRLGSLEKLVISQFKSHGWMK